MLAQGNAWRCGRPCARAEPRVALRQHACSLVRSRCSVVARADASSSAEAEIVHDVVELRGIRVSLDQTDPVVEYRVKWKDEAPDTWELASNVSPDLIRDFDERWWQASKKADAATMSSMLSFGREVLSQVVDENRRSALHFAAAVGATKCCQLLLEAGADINLQDREGYTPLHMAAGYMQLDAMAVLLEAGADPELQDKNGRDVVTLVDGLRGQMPANPALLQRRLALEQVNNVLVDRLYDEVEVESILEQREDGEGEVEYLVQFKDGGVDTWLPARDVAPDVVADWEAGLERAPVGRLLDLQQFGEEREFLVEWSDDTPDSWEPEENLPPELIEAFQEQRPDLFKAGKSKKRSERRKRRRARKAAVAGPTGTEQGQEPSAAVADSGDAASTSSPSSSEGSSSSSGPVEASVSGSGSGDSRTAVHAAGNGSRTASSSSDGSVVAAHHATPDHTSSTDAQQQVTEAAEELLAAAGTRKG